MRIIAVTGASGYVGQRVVAQLAAAPQIERILALDIHPATFPSDKVTFIQHDVTQPMTALFEEHGVDAAAHFAFVLNPIHDRARERQINIGGTENFLRACHAVQAKTVLITSSATAYGAWPDNPLQLDETMPLRGKPGFFYVEDKVKQDLLTQQYAQGHPQSRVIITRMSVVMGPHVSNYISRYFLKAVAVMVRGSDPPAPIVHEDDVAQATACLFLQAPSGAYNLDAPNPISVRQGIAAIGGRVVALPPAILYPVADLGWKLRLKFLTEAPSPMLDYLRYSWSCDGRKVTRYTDFRYQYDAAACIAAFARFRQEQKEGNEKMVNG
ncbi:MAG: NAD-dependent epimerase/dehydratase family protein [Chloroflexi bacterium]|nr:NAD-dependent epimerase/dehydratase family protein [Chloroflexota bacterium]MBP8055404.1 NAD-dependent epimerase/dehydratase family protein [Chloroflexota bacterium]